MTKVAVVFAEGFEEIEALSPVDVFRRAGFDCNMLGLESASVTGSHGIQVAMDGVFDGNFADYDLVVLPGGMPGSTNLRDNQALIASLQEAAKAGKYVAAICAAPIVLDVLACSKGVNSHVSQVLRTKLHLASIKLTWWLLMAILSLAVVPEQP